MKSYSDNDLICRFSDQGGAISDRVSDAGIINLRPHHLLCIQKFTGHGYDEAFTAHMSELADSFVTEPGRVVELVYGTDELCSVCPNRQESCCRSEEKVQRMDRAVLAICRLNTGDAAEWAGLADKAKKLILSTDAFENVCGNCQWFELCKNT